MARGLNAPVASSAGRLFDAAASLLGLRDVAEYEAQAAIDLEIAAGDRTPAPPAVRGSSGATACWSTTRGRRWRALLGAARPAAAPRALAAFQATIADGHPRAARGGASRATGVETVCLSGGVFQNRRLAGALLRRLARDGFEVFINRRVPVNDGGISYGQAAVAAGEARHPAPRARRPSRREDHRMCLGIPGRVIEIRDEAGLPMGKVDFGGVRKDACLAYMPEVQLGDYVIVHVGFAISQVDEDEALKTLEILATMGDLVQTELATMGPGMDEPAVVRTTRRRAATFDGHGLAAGPEARCVKYLDEYRDPVLARKLIAEIHRITTRPWTLMEVCGGQTHTIVKQGIDEALPEGVRMIHGPGCPVCVTPLEQIDKALAIAARPDVIFTSYGDMLRVPGSTTDLLALKARGADVRIVYSPLDALKIAVANPDRQVVFFAVGFETTAPANAMAVAEAARRGIDNFSVLVSHVLVPPAMMALLESPANQVQAFLAAGPRLRGHGLDRVRADRREVPRADRGHRLRAARPPRGHPDGDPPAGGGPPRGGEPVRPGRQARRRAARPGADLPGLRGRRAEVAGDRGDPGLGLPAAREVRPIRRGAPVLRRRHPHPGAPRLHRRCDPDRREDAARLHGVRRRCATRRSHSARRW